MSQNLDLTIDKFTKASAYEMLTNLGNTLNFASDEDKTKYVNAIEESQTSKDWWCY